MTAEDLLIELERIADDLAIIRKRKTVVEMDAADIQRNEDKIEDLKEKIIYSEIYK